MTVLVVGARLRVPAAGGAGSDAGRQVPGKGVMSDLTRYRG